MSRTGTVASSEAMLADNGRRNSWRSVVFAQNHAVLVSEFVRKILRAYGTTCSGARTRVMVRKLTVARKAAVIAQ